MEEKKEETKKGKEGRLLIGMAVAVLVVILCLMLDVRIGVGALVGIVAGSFLRPLLKDLFTDEPQEEPEENRFLDTAVLRENFSIPQNLPIPYAVLDIRGRVMMYNAPFAAVFPNSEDAKSVIEVLRKTSGAGEPQRVTVGDRSYKAALNHCDVVDKSGAVGAVLTLIMMDITKTCQLEKELEEQETVVGMILLDNYDDVLDSIDENRLPILSALIDRKFNQLAQASDAVIKKLEKDRYIFLLSKGSLERLKDQGNLRRGTHSCDPQHGDRYRRRLSGGRHGKRKSGYGLGSGPGRRSGAHQRRGKIPVLRRQERRNPPQCPYPCPCQSGCPYGTYGGCF